MDSCSLPRERPGGRRSLAAVTHAATARTGKSVRVYQTHSTGVIGSTDTNSIEPVRARRVRRIARGDENDQQPGMPMSATRQSVLFAALAASLSLAAEVRAQAYGAEVIVENNDLRWFEPVELDLDGRVEPDRRGLFFRFEKLAWSITGERITIGDPDTVYLSEQIYRPNDTALVQEFVNDLAVAGFSPAEIQQFVDVTFAMDMGSIVFVDVVIPGTGDPDATPPVPPTTVQSPLVESVESNPPDQIPVVNGIQDAAPEADFAWGERYEFGYSDGESGWMVGILDGPEQTIEQQFGAGEGTPFTSQSPADIPATDRFTFSDDLIDFNEADLDNDGELSEAEFLAIEFPDALDGNDIFALGFGSVAVNFAAPEDFFVGFRDYQVNTGPTAGTVYGPNFYIGNIGGIEDNEDFDDDSEVTQIADDLDGDLDSFFLITVDLDGDGEIDDDEIVGTFIDYDDLFEFNVYFDQVNVRNITELDGIELMTTYDIDRGHKQDRGRRDYLQIAYGVRYMQLDDLFEVEMLGSILGRTSAAVEIDNQLIGPQLAARWTRDHGRWDFTVDGRVMLAYNVVDKGLNGIFGEELIPGAINRPINGRTTTTVLGDRDDDFSPLIELRIEARYKITRALALKIGYTGKFIDNLQRASRALAYTAPSFSFTDTGTTKTDIFINGINGGFELRY